MEHGGTRRPPTRGYTTCHHKVKSDLRQTFGMVETGTVVNITRWIFDVLVATVLENPVWTAVILVTFWYLRWWNYDRTRAFGRGADFGDTLGTITSRANPFQIISSGLRRDVSASRKKIVAVVTFFTGGFFVIFNTVGWSVEGLITIEPTAWVAAAVGAYSAVRILGVDVPVVVLLALMTIVGLVAFFLRRRRRGW